MAADLAKLARREAENLEQALEKNPTFRKWKAAMALVREYEAGPASAPEPSAIAPQVRRATTSVSTRVQQAAIEFLRVHGRRAKAREIYDAIKDQGLPIKGEDPVATVAAHMSNAKKQVDNIRGEGYGLIEWGSPPVLLQQ